MSIELPTLSNSHESIATTEEQSLNRGAVWSLWMHATWIGIRYKVIQGTYERTAQCKGTICMESAAGVQTVILYSNLFCLFEYQRHCLDHKVIKTLQDDLWTLCWIELFWTRILSLNYDHMTQKWKFLKEDKQ